MSYRGGARLPASPPTYQVDNALLAGENEQLKGQVGAERLRGDDAAHRNAVLMDEVQSCQRGLAAVTEEKAVAKKEKDVLQQSNKLMLQRIEKLEALSKAQMDNPKQKEMTGVLAELRTFKTQLSSENEKLKKHLQAKQEAILDLETVLRNPAMSPQAQGRGGSQGSARGPGGSPPNNGVDMASPEVVELRGGVEQRMRFMENVNRTLKADNESLNSTLDQLQQSVYSLRASKMDDLAEIEALTTDLEGEKQKAANLQAALRRAEADNEAKDAELVAFRAARERREVEHQQERVALEERARALADDVARITQEAEVARARAEDNHRELADALAEERRKVAEVLRHEGALKAEIEALGGSSSSAAAQWREEATYVSKQLQSERNALQREVDALRGRLAQDAGTAGLRAKLVALQAAHSAVVQRVSEAATRPPSALKDTTVEALAAQLDAATASNLALTHEVDFLRHQLMRWEAGEQPPNAFTPGGPGRYHSPSLQTLSPPPPQSPSGSTVASPGLAVTPVRAPPLPLPDALGLTDSSVRPDAAKDMEVLRLKQRIQGLEVERAALEAEVWKQRQRSQSQREALEGSEDASRALSTEMEERALKLHRLEHVELPSLKDRIAVLEARANAERVEAHAQAVLYKSEKEQRIAVENLRKETLTKLNAVTTELEDERRRAVQKARAAAVDSSLPVDQRNKLNELVTIERQRREEKEAEIVRLRAELSIVESRMTLHTSESQTSASAEKQERALREQMERELATQTALKEEAIANHNAVQVQKEHLAARLTAVEEQVAAAEAAREQVQEQHRAEAAEARAARESAARGQAEAEASALEVLRLQDRVAQLRVELEQATATGEDTAPREAVAALEGQLAESKAAGVQLAADLDAASARAAAAAADVARLQADVDAAAAREARMCPQEDVAAAEARAARATAEIETLKHVVKDTTAACARLENDLAAARQSVRRQSASSADIQQQVQETHTLQRNISTLTKERDEAYRLKSKIVMDFEALQIQNYAAEQDLKNLKAEAAGVTDLKNANAELTAAHEDLKRRVGDAEEEVRRLRAQVAEESTRTAPLFLSVAGDGDHAGSQHSAGVGGVPRIARESSAMTTHNRDAAEAEAAMRSGDLAAYSITRTDSDWTMGKSRGAGPQGDSEAVILLQEIEKVNTEKAALQDELNALKATVRELEAGGAAAAGQAEDPLSEASLMKQELLHLTQDVKDFKAKVRNLEQANRRLTDDNDVLRQQMKRSENAPTPVETAEELSRMEGLLDREQSKAAEAESAEVRWKDIANEAQLECIDLRRSLNEARDELHSMRAVLDGKSDHTPPDVTPAPSSPPTSNKTPRRERGMRPAKKHKLELWQAQCLVDGWKMEMARFFTRYKAARRTARAFEQERMMAADVDAGECEGRPAPGDSPARRVSSALGGGGGPTALSPFGTAVATSAVWVFLLSAACALVVRSVDPEDMDLRVPFTHVQQVVLSVSAAGDDATQTPPAGDVDGAV